MTETITLTLPDTPGTMMEPTATLRVVIQRHDGQLRIQQLWKPLVFDRKALNLNAGCHWKDLDVVFENYPGEVPRVVLA